MTRQGRDIPNTSTLASANFDGTVTAVSLADNSASGDVTGPDGKTYPNYSFTLAASSHLLKLPPLNSARIYVSLGAPANSYAAFWHDHSIGNLAYGFAFDDVNSQSSVLVELVRSTWPSA